MYQTTYTLHNVKKYANEERKMCPETVYVLVKHISGHP